MLRKHTINNCTSQSFWFPQPCSIACLYLPARLFLTWRILIPSRQPKNNSRTIVWQDAKHMLPFPKMVVFPSFPDLSVKPYSFRPSHIGLCISFPVPSHIGAAFTWFLSLWWTCICHFWLLKNSLTSCPDQHTSCTAFWRIWYAGFHSECFICCDPGMESVLAANPLYCG